MQQLAIEQFRQHLIRQERSIATVEKYIWDTRNFLAFVDGKELSKDLTMQYKETLVRSGYAVRSINSMLAAVNSFLEFMNRRECRVKTIKLQKEVYCREDRLLTNAAVGCRQSPSQTIFAATDHMRNRDLDIGAVAFYCGSGAAGGGCGVL